METEEEEEEEDSGEFAAHNSDCGHATQILAQYLSL